MSDEHLVRQDVDINLIEPNPDNPNEMSDAEFNMLADNMEKVGFVDPLFVRPHPEKDGYYRLIGGHHRLEVAKLFGYDKVPVTVITDPNFTEEMEKFQMVRMNVIHGQLSPKKFMKLYESLSDEYSEEVASEMFGFVDEEEFKKLIQQTEASLPIELKEQFKEAKDEIKTIEDLSQLLNRLFTQFGDTLNYNYMLLDYGGKDSIWIRMAPNEYSHAIKLAEACVQHQVPMDKVVAKLLVGWDDSVFEGIEKVKIGEDVDIPTLDFLDE